MSPGQTLDTPHSAPSRTLEHHGALRGSEQGSWKYLEAIKEGPCSQLLPLGLNEQFNLNYYSTNRSPTAPVRCPCFLLDLQETHSDVCLDSSLSASTELWHADRSAGMKSCRVAVAATFSCRHISTYPFFSYNGPSPAETEGPALGSQVSPSWARDPSNLQTLSQYFCRMLETAIMVSGDCKARRL